MRLNVSVSSDLMDENFSWYDQFLIDQLDVELPENEKERMTLRSALITAMLTRLDQRDRYILRTVCRPSNNKKDARYTLLMAAETLDITQERVRQLKNLACYALYRHPVLSSLCAQYKKKDQQATQ